MNPADDKFHERFVGVNFQDDIPIHVWREAWESCKQYYNIPRESDEADKQVWATRNDS